MAWKVVKSTEKYRNTFMTVYEEILETEHGDVVTYGIVRKEPGVSIVPWDGSHYYLIKQYRHSVEFTGWEFPAGHMEHANIDEAARAELREEAGITAGSLQEIGRGYPAPGHLSQEIHYFLATDLTFGEQKLEPSEKGMVVQKFTEHEIKSMIKNGEIKDGLTITAFMLMESRK